MFKQFSKLIGKSVNLIIINHMNSLRNFCFLTALLQPFDYKLCKIATNTSIQ